MWQANTIHWEQLPWMIFGFEVWSARFCWRVHPIWITISEVFRISNRQKHFSIFCLHEMTLPAGCSLLQQKKWKQKQSHPLQRLQLECEQMFVYKDIAISKRRQRCLLFFHPAANWAKYLLLAFREQCVLISLASKGSCTLLSSVQRCTSNRTDTCTVKCEL